LSLRALCLPPLSNAVSQSARTVRSRWARSVAVNETVASKTQFATFLMISVLPRRTPYARLPDQTLWT
jgi:hypothetical protein